MNSKHMTIRRAFAAHVPSKTSREAYLSALGIASDRFDRLLEGELPTPAEAASLAQVLGGVPGDYRDFVLVEDPWFSSQPVEIRAHVARLMGEGLKGPREDLEDERKFSGRMAKWGLVAAAVFGLSVLNAVWVNSRFARMRPEAYRYAARMYGQRDLALATLGVEEAKAAIVQLRAVSTYVDANFPDRSAEASKIQGFLLDGVRYYSGLGRIYEERQARAKGLLEAPARAGMSHKIFDAITGQEVDLEDPNGGSLDMTALRDLVRAQMRTKEFLRLADDLAKGRAAADRIPSGETWTQAAKGGL